MCYLTTKIYDSHIIFAGTQVKFFFLSFSFLFEFDFASAHARSSAHDLNFRNQASLDLMLWRWIQHQQESITQMVSFGCLFSVENFHQRWEDKYLYISFSMSVKLRWCSGRDASPATCVLCWKTTWKLHLWKMSKRPEWADCLSGAPLGGFQCSEAGL